MEAERSAYNRYVYCDIGWPLRSGTDFCSGSIGCFIMSWSAYFCMSIIRGVTRIIRVKG